MSSSADTDRIAQALAAGVEEAVEINQRGLVEKILARYSAEYTVFRELLQNADDASALSIEIHFQTPSGFTDVNALKGSTYSKCTVRNDGIVFRDEDWSRLKLYQQVKQLCAKLEHYRCIADGQPDESSIGAFGVGFYSIFSESDEPLVISGDSMMLFFWKGDRLAVKRAINPENSLRGPNGRPWTAIHMPCRQNIALPDAAEFAKFLGTALAFTRHIQTMTLKIDQLEVCHLQKKSAPSCSLAAPPGVTLRSPNNHMSIVAMETLPLQLDCRIMRGALASLQQATLRNYLQDAKASFATKFLSFATGSKKAVEPERSSAPATDPREYLKSTSFLKIVTGEVRLSLPATTVKEFERATKKSPPKTTRLQILFTSRDEADATEGTAGDSEAAISARYVVSGLTQEIGKQGRIFIGFPSHQSVGCCASIAGQFVPTVERENLDLQSRAIAEYNRELLSVAGILCRCIYDSELRRIETMWTVIDKSDDIRRRATIQSASHVMAFFTFRPSTPFTEAGMLIASSFFGCNQKEFLLISNRGVLSASKVRIPAPDLQFLTSLPVVAADAAKDNALLLEHLQDRNFIRNVTIDDVIQQLNERPLDIAEATALLKWWISLSWNSSYDSGLLPRLRNATVIAVPAEDVDDKERIVQLSAVTAFLNTKTIAPDFPLPPYVLPYAVSRNLATADLIRVFGLTELSVADWIKYLRSPLILSDIHYSLTMSATFAERFLLAVAKVWGNLPASQASAIVAQIQHVACIPTKKGMHLPGEAYLPKVTLFDDLPVTTVVLRGSMEKLLTALGVRTHVDLALVFSRLLGGGQWQQEQVARYLVSVTSTLTSEEKDRLSKTAWLTQECTSSEEQSDKPHRFQARKLYEPNDALRELGLPIVAWKGSKWRTNSDEARLLYSMGLRRHPDVEVLLALASDVSDTQKQEKARAYFLAHFESTFNQSYRPSKHNFAFVPATQNGKPIYAAPNEVYSAPGSAIFGFAILRPEFTLHAAKFKLASDPKPTELVAALLKTPPSSTGDAVPKFAYLATQAGSFSSTDISTLAGSKFIPAQSGLPKFDLYTPRQVYFKAQEGGLAQHFHSLFTFVDFGTTSNAFLLLCGVRAEPSTAELTQLLLANPHRFLSLAGSADLYIALLRQVATHYSSFSGALKRKMKDTPFVLGYEQARGVQRSKPGSLMDDEDEEVVLQYKLGLASEIVIIDDTTTLNDFREFIVAAPQDDLIEAFVEDLGGKRISRLVTTQYTSSTVPETSSDQALQLRKLVLERAALFLHERQQTSKDIRFGEDWLKSHLLVKEVARIERQRILTLNGARHIKTSTATAAATLGGGELLLRVSANMENLDFYEVAASLTGHMLNKQRIHDTLLFMTLLQTSLRDLKRRGFNVDRIMNARKTEQAAVEQKLREERAEQDMRMLQERQRKDSDSSFDNRTLPGGMPSSPKHRKALMPPDVRPPTLPPRTSLFDNLKQKLRQHPMMPPQGINDIVPPAAEHNTETQSAPPALPPRQGEGDIRAADNQITPSANIAMNVHRAIQASRPDRSGNITNEVQTEMVKESTGSYCDSSPAADLAFVAEVAGIRLYLTRGVEPENILGQRGHELRSYIDHIVKPVGKLYNMDLKALHVFYDTHGPTIAFNRSGSVFLNFRYHLAWHGAQISGGRYNEALISTYFSVAHELAHNLVLPHNSEHAFYTSHIAQTYFLALAGHIAEIGGEA